MPRHSQSDGWQIGVAPVQPPLQFTLPLASSPHSQAQVSGLRTRVGPHSWFRSHSHEHVSVFHANPGAQVALSSHTHAQLAASHVSPRPQPPQAGRHSTTHVVWLQRSGAVMAEPVPQSAGHS